jgi:hypothetical protein
MREAITCRTLAMLLHLFDRFERRSSWPVRLGVKATAELSVAAAHCLEGLVDTPWPYLVERFAAVCVSAADVGGTLEFT